MKPLKLIVQAFGPFAGREEIDFTKLGENPLFLIDGETGAGKSTLLDAICFALYGGTTGAEREPAEMRCDRAEPGKLTEVTLIFELNGKKYQIVRSPQQERPKVKGEGFTDHKSKATLHEILPEDETRLIVAKSVSDANQEIQDMTGLNVEQFRQVMVLPQGKFRELLKADSGSREKIFGKLFQTGIYKGIEERLKLKVSNIRIELTAHENNIRGILQAANVNEEAEIAQELEALTPDLAKANSEKVTTEKALTEAIKKKEAGETLAGLFVAYDKTQSDLSLKQQQRSEIEQNKCLLAQGRSAEKIQPILLDVVQKRKEKDQIEIDIKNAASQLDKARDKKDQAKQTFDKAAEEYKAVDSIKAERTTISAYEEKITHLMSAKKTAEQADLQKKASGNALQVLEKQRVDKISQRDQHDQQIVTTQQEIEPLSEMEINLSELTGKLDKRKKLNAECDDYQNFTEVLAEQNAKLDDSKAKAEKSNQTAKELEYQWHSGQAALLASELKSGEPCPVCGSDEHPKPAQIQGNEQLVTREEVDASRKVASENDAAMRRQEKLTDDAKRDLQECQKRIDRLTTELGNIAEKTLEEITLSHSDLSTRVSQLKAKKNSLAGLQQKFEVAKAEIIEIDTKLDTAKAQADKGRESLIEAQSAVNHLTEEVPEVYQSEGALEDALKKLDEQVTRLETAYREAENSHSQSKTDYTKAETTLSQLKGQLSRINEKMQKAATDWNDALEQSEFKDESAFNAALLNEKQQVDLSEAVQAFEDEWNQLKGAEESQKQELKDKTRPDVESLTTTLKEAINLRDIKSENWRELDKRHSQLKEIRTQLEKAHEGVAEIEAQYAIYGTLSDVASGQTGNRISLQRFVLGVLLDEVLIEASHRLKSMSKGRYLLIRKGSKAKGNRASGLDLEVEDTYTGKSRSAGTLSGGESFMAALSLALGLSSVVQSHAGGIKLDTLFIDEGFGSLDGGHLDLAIQTLMDLRDSGRMIGVISHVSELKEQMKTRVAVMASRDGSSVKIVAA